MSLAFVTDSTADLPLDLVKKHQIEVIPNILVIDQQSYLDGEGMSREEFYRRLPACVTPPTTSAPAIGVFQQTYERLCRQGIGTILSIHPSAKLSSLFNTACLAAKEVAEKFHACIQVIDSAQVTMAMGFQVLGAVESAARGCSREDILAWLEKIQSHTHLYALLDTLEYVRRSGRVHWATATLGNLLHVKTLIGVRDGIVQRLGMCQNRRQGVSLLINKLQRLGPLDYLAILHTTIHSEAEIQEILKNAPPSIHPPLILPVTTVIGTHVGPDGLGFAALEKI